MSSLLFNKPYNEREGRQGQNKELITTEVQI